MKKVFLFSVLMAMTTVNASAQLKVSNNGRVGAVVSYPVPQAAFSAGIRDSYNYTNYAFGIWAREEKPSTFCSIGVRGYATSSTQSNRTIGIQGIGGNGENGWNFGVVGGLGSEKNGAGVFGTTAYHAGKLMHGRYAGYFDGSVYIDTLSVRRVITPSDARLKENITSLSRSRGGGALDRIMDMNVVSYNYKRLNHEDSDTASATTMALFQDEKKLPQQRHYGLIAQELKELYPDLVVTGQDGYLGVNYIELVPILIRSIQELKAELNEIKGDNGSVRMARAADIEDEETAEIGDATAIPAAATLFQNTPNPFSERTTIRFTLPENAKNAFIYIFDMSGKMQKQIPIDGSMQSITINGYELSAGMYIYSLVIGGKEVQTRRMILSK